MARQATSNSAWQAQPGGQRLFLACPYFEVLLHGNRGGGKTDALLMDFARHVGQGFGPAWRGILFRREYKELADVVAKSKNWFPRMFPGCRFLESQADFKWRFTDGEELLFRTAKKMSDYNSYHGHSYPWIGWEELTNWGSPDLYNAMKSVCRSSIPGMPRKYRATTNPAGPGHAWVKRRFIDPAPSGRPVKSKSGRVRVAIMAKYEDNRVFIDADPDYMNVIKESANEAQRKAWVEGSWDIVSGGMFDDKWNRSVHVVPTFKVPASWRIDRSFDWGSSTPFAVVWWAESDGTELVLDGGERVQTVRGDLYAISEWYGWNGKPNEGLRMLATEIARGIVKREEDMGIRGRVKPGPADNQIMARSNGVCIADDMRALGVSWTESDKSAGSRKQGWESIRIRLDQAVPKGPGLPRERPGLFICTSCVHGIRQISTTARSDKDPDEIHESAEDHWLDAARYRIFQRREFIGTMKIKGF